jgi:hypothetical protein
MKPGPQLVLEATGSIIDGIGKTSARTSVLDKDAQPLNNPLA